MFIKNWNKFQHFKDRKPPWIKLYRDILDNIHWHELEPLPSKVLVMCWLIASENDGRLPDTKTLAFRLRMTEKQTIDCLNNLSHWLEQGDSRMISGQYQDDRLETERETETETETEKHICPPDGEPDDVPVKKFPPCDHKAVIAMYHENLPTLRRVEVWNEARSGYLRQRWREVCEDLSKDKEVTVEDVFEWWGQFFRHVAKSKFLTGKVNSSNGRSFVADLEWLIRPTNFAKIIEGKYHGNQ